MLFGVEYLAVPRHLDCIELELANEQEWRCVEGGFASAQCSKTHQD
jgi:hypothetical protein